MTAFRAKRSTRITALEIHGQRVSLTPPLKLEAGETLRVEFVPGGDGRDRLIMATGFEDEVIGIQWIESGRRTRHLGAGR